MEMNPLESAAVAAVGGVPAELLDAAGRLVITPHALTLEGQRTATVAHRRIVDYVAGVAAGTPWAEQEALDPLGAAEELVLLGLRTVEGVSLTTLQTLGLSDQTGPLADLLADGFLALNQGRVAATTSGRPVLDAVLRTLLT